MCDGPPSIMRKMQFFARAGRCGGFGPGASAARVSRAVSAVRATLPRLAPRPYRKSRRVGLVNEGEFIRVEEDETEFGEAAHFHWEVGDLQVGHEIDRGLERFGE